MTFRTRIRLKSVKQEAMLRLLLSHSNGHEKVRATVGTHGGRCTLWCGQELIAESGFGRTNAAFMWERAAVSSIAYAVERYRPYLT